MSEIEFGELPPSRQGRGQVDRSQEISSALVERPGEWAKVGRYNPSYAVRIKTGGIKAFAPAGTFEAVSRNTGHDDDGAIRSDIWARYIGPNGEYR